MSDPTNLLLFLISQSVIASNVNKSKGEILAFIFVFYQHLIEFLINCQLLKCSANLNISLKFLCNIIIFFLNYYENVLIIQISFI